MRYLFVGRPNSAGLITAPFRMLLLKDFTHRFVSVLAASRYAVILISAFSTEYLYFYGNLCSIASIFFLPPFRSLPVPSHPLSRRPPARSPWAHAQRVTLGLRSANALSVPSVLSLCIVLVRFKTIEVSVIWRELPSRRTRADWEHAMSTLAGGWRHAFSSSFRYRRQSYDRAGVHSSFWRKIKLPVHSTILA